MPTLTEIEWRVKPLLEEWAEVGAYDAPGVGHEPPVDDLGLEALQQRAHEEIERLGWDRFVIAADEYGGYIALRVALAHRDQVAGFAFGHACLSYRDDGDRPPVGHEVMTAVRSLAETDYRSYARALTQITQGAYDDAIAEEYMVRVPREVTLTLQPQLTGPAMQEDAEALLRELDCPLLLAQHEGCIAWTPEGYEDAVKAFPEATTFSTEQKPSASPEFAAALREFCRGLDWGEAG